MSGIYPNPQGRILIQKFYIPSIWVLWRPLGSHTFLTLRLTQECPCESGCPNCIVASRWQICALCAVFWGRFGLGHIQRAQYGLAKESTSNHTVLSSCKVFLKQPFSCSLATGSHRLMSLLGPGVALPRTGEYLFLGISCLCLGRGLSAPSCWSNTAPRMTEPVVYGLQMAKGVRSGGSRNV